MTRSKKLNRAYITREIRRRADNIVKDSQREGAINVSFSYAVGTVRDNMVLEAKGRPQLQRLIKNSAEALTKKWDAQNPVPADSNHAAYQTVLFE